METKYQAFLGEKGKDGNEKEENGTEEMQEYAKKYCPIDVIYFWRSICKEKKTMPKNSKWLEESLRGSKNVKNLKKMKNKTNIKFGSCMTGGVKQI